MLYGYVTLNSKDNKARSSVRAFVCSSVRVSVFVCLWSAVSATCNFFKPKIDTSAICMLTKVQKNVKTTTILTIITIIYNFSFFTLKGIHIHTHTHTS